MKRVSPVFLFTLALCVTALSQSPAPTPPRDDDRDVVKITTNLIQVDVTVTDAKGQIVTDLKPGEVEIYENGKKQNITNFSFINAESRTIEKQTPGRAGDKNKPVVPPPPLKLKPEQVRRTFALVVDDLNLSFESTYHVRQALKKFVDEQMQPSDLVAIVRTASGVGALQQFTSDKRQLYAAIERVRWYPSGRAGISAFPAIEAGLSKNIRPPSLIGKQPDEDVKEAEAYRQEKFQVGTMGALQYILYGMGNLPGRKSVVLFSDGITFVSDQGLNPRVFTALRVLVDMANRAAVLIYTMDARGLQPLELTAEDSVSEKSLGQVLGPIDEIQASLRARRDEFFNSQGGLDYLAKVTGGFAIKNQNDLSGGLQKVLNDQAGYYLVGYQPDDELFDPVKRRFNQLDVKVTRPGLKVRFRSGFFGIKDKDEKNFAAAPKTVREQILTALLSPFATGEITVRLTPVFTDTVRQGAYVSSLIHVKASDLKFTDEPDGWKKTVFDIVVVAMGDTGAVVDSVSHTETMQAKGPTYEKIMRDGFVYSISFPIKKPGAYQMRVALRDAGTTKIGSANQFVEVPDLRKDRVAIGGIILQNVDDDKSNEDNTAAPDASSADYIQATALREFKSGSALFYNVVIFNPKLDPAGKPRFKTQVKIFRDEKEVFTGKESEYVVDAGADLKRLPLRGALRLGPALPPGQYTLQVIVWDLLAKENRQIKTEWLDFEIVN